MLAALTLFGMRDINAMNGLKMALVGVMTISAIVAFVIADVARWPETLPMLAGAIAGSYFAARWAQRLDQRLIKGFVTILGIFFLARRLGDGQWAPGCEVPELRLSERALTEREGCNCG